MTGRDSVSQRFNASAFSPADEGGSAEGRAATVFSINPAGPIDWGDLAGGAGYFDQAHFGHEFREFTGLTPTRYVEVRRRFQREHPGHVLDGWPLPAD